MAILVSESVHVDKGILDSYEQTTFFNYLTLVDHGGSTGHGVSMLFNVVYKAI